jgi:cytochrome c biogenesis protein CcmG/thiol:disulfide interchange protein DsbE
MTPVTSTPTETTPIPAQAAGLSWRRAALPLAVFVVLVGLLALGLRHDPRELPSPLVGRPAPAFRVATLVGPTPQLARDDLRGQVWMLNVWASWCAACRIEHPVLVDFARGGALPVYGLNYKDTTPEALRWLAAHGDPYQASLSDPEGRLGMEFGVYGVPETFLIDQEGIVRFKHVGPLTPEVLQQQILPLVRRLRG